MWNAIGNKNEICVLEFDRIVKMSKGGNTVFRHFLFLEVSGGMLRKMRKSYVFIVD